MGAGKAWLGTSPDAPVLSPTGTRKWLDDHLGSGSIYLGSDGHGSHKISFVASKSFDIGRMETTIGVEARCSECKIASRSVARFNLTLLGSGGPKEPYVLVAGLLKSARREFRSLPETCEEALMLLMARSVLES